MYVLAKSCCSLIDTRPESNLQITFVQMARATRIVFPWGRGFECAHCRLFMGGQVAIIPKSRDVAGGYFPSIAFDNNMTKVFFCSMTDVRQCKYRFHNDTMEDKNTFGCYAWFFIERGGQRIDIFHHTKYKARSIIYMFFSIMSACGDI